MVVSTMSVSLVIADILATTADVENSLEIPADT
jgi:hypothetical protein